MKRLLIIGVCALVPLVPARADLPVIDGASLLQLLKEVQQAAQEIQLLQQQVQQVMTIYNAIAHVTDLGTALISALRYARDWNPLPVNPYPLYAEPSEWSRRHDGHVRLDRLLVQFELDSRPRLHADRHIL